MKSILIVDDNHENIYLQQTLLEASGYKIVTAFNGKEALEKLNDNKVDLIISDILMPIMDGFLFCFECKNDIKLKKIPFIFYSATYTDSEDEEFAKKLGASNFITKPTDFDNLLNIIEETISNQNESIIDHKINFKEDDVFVLFSSSLINKLEKKNLELKKEIQERNRITIELEKSHQREKALIDGFPDKFFIINKNGIFIDYHSPNNQITFAQPNDFIGKKITTILPKELADKTLSNIRTVLSGKIVPSHLYSLEYPEELLHFEARYVVLNDKEVLVIVRDITKTIVSEQLLMRSEAKLKEAQSIANIGNWEIDLINKSQTWSNELFNIFGLDPKEIKPSIKLFLSFIHPDDKDYVALNINKVIEENKMVSFNFKFLNKNGKLGFGSSDTRIEFNEKNKPIRIFGIVKDVTLQKLDELKLKQQNLELQKTNSELDRFVYSTSHDLRAPLTSILGLINILKEEIDTKHTEQIDLLEMMTQSVTKLDDFIGDIINFSRNSRTKIEHLEINFSELIEETIKQLKYITINSEINFDVDINQKVKFISDKLRIEIILKNLISNAIKYQDSNKEKKVVNISIKTDKLNVIIIIKDNGIGIEKNKIEKIYGMFYRGTDLSTGSGLGLYIVNETIDKLNGTIKLESKPKEGSKFIITIPNLS